MVDICSFQLLVALTISIVFNFTYGSSNAEVILGHPNTNFLAANYRRYFLTATLPNPGKDVTCEWFFNTSQGGSSVRFYASVGSGQFDCYDTNFTEFMVAVSCSEHTSNSLDFFTTTFKYLFPLPPGNIITGILCDSDGEVDRKTATVRNCTSSTLSNGVVVTPMSLTFSEEAQFSCHDGGALFYSNKTMLSQPTTQCLADTTWSGQNNLQCWNSPVDVAIIGASEPVLEGNVTYLNCSYTDVLPIGNLSEYFVGQNSYIAPKDMMFQTPVLNASDNGKAVYCRAITPFTEVEPGSGKSSKRFLDILYAPYQNKTNPNMCIWIIGETDTCEVKFFANPTPMVLSLQSAEKNVRNDEPITSQIIDGTNGELTFQFKRIDISLMDNGTYILMVQSEMFSSPSNITFTIAVNKPPDGLDLDLGLIIGIAAAAVVLVFLIVLFITACKRNAFGKKEPRSSPVALFADHAVEVCPNPYEDGGHQMEDNPLYNADPIGSGRVNAAVQHGPEDPYSIVEERPARVNAIEKVERVNVIYDGAAFSGITDAATPHSKNEKKEEIKETEEERQARLEGLYTFVNKKVKKNPKAGKKLKLNKENVDEDQNTCTDSASRPSQNETSA